jgi:hypothetical protein
MHHREQMAIQRELRRVGVDLAQVAGLAFAAGGPSLQDLIAWLRRLPTGMGHNQFVERWEAAGPRAGLAAGEGVPPPDPEFQDPETDELEALLDEIERVCPLSAQPDGFGLVFPHGLTAALAALRRLPSGSSPDVVVRALAEPPNNGQ